VAVKRGTAPRKDSREISDSDFLVELAKAKKARTNWPSVPAGLNLIARLAIAEHPLGLAGWYRDHPSRARAERTVVAAEKTSKGPRLGSEEKFLRLCIEAKEAGQALPPVPHWLKKDAKEEISAHPRGLPGWVSRHPATPSIKHAVLQAINDERRTAVAALGSTKPRRCSVVSSAGERCVSTATADAFYCRKHLAR
jgi:hypothetical protein